MQIEIDGVGTFEIDDAFRSAPREQQERILRSLVSTLKANGVKPGAKAPQIDDVEAASAVGRVGDPNRWSAIDEAAAAMTFGLGPRASALGGAIGSAITGRGFNYSDRLAEIDADREAYREAYPVRSAAANIAGAIGAMGTRGGIAASRALTNLATRGGASTGLGARTLDAAAQGALFSGLTAAGESRADNPLDRAGDAVRGASIGAMIGGASAPILAGAGKVAEKVMDAGRMARAGLTGSSITDDVAAKRVSRALARDAASGASGMTDDAYRLAQAEGQPVRNIDRGGETTRALARNAANVSPDAKNVLDAAVNPRYADQTTRITGKIEALFGGKLNTFDDAARLESTARVMNRKAYDAARSAPQAASMWDEGFEQIMQAPAVQKAAKEATTRSANRAAVEGFTPVKQPFVFDDATGRFTLKDPNIKPNLDYWDAVSRNLNSEIGKAKTAGDKTTAAELTALRRALLDMVDAKVPLFKDARLGAKAFFDAEDALEAGANFAIKRYDIREAAAQLGKMNKAEKELFARGFADATVQRLSKLNDSRNAVNAIGNNPYIKKQLHLALGPQRARELETFLRAENTMNLARTAIQGNSTTAQQLYAMGVVGGGLGGFAYGRDMESALKGSMTGLLIAGITRGGQAAGRRLNESTARKVAEMLASDDPNKMAQAIKLVAQNKALYSGLRAAEAYISRLAGRVGATSMIGPGSGQGQGTTPPAR